MVTIDSKRCTGCGACVEVCPVGAIWLIKGPTGTHAEIDEAKCRQCGACVEACPERAITSEGEPVLEGEIVQVKTAFVPAKPQPGQVYPLQRASKAMTWLGPALAFVGREVVPRAAAVLLDAWDRRSDRPVSWRNDSQPTRPVQRSMTNLVRKGGRRRRRRRGR